MNNIIECKLESTYKEIYTGLWQHDYGQILRITGVEFPKAVEIQFSLNKKSGSTITRIGTTVDGVTEVQIPNELLKNGGRTYDYCIYAYIYLTDETSGSTEYEIVLHVKSRTKPENPSEEPLPEPNIFHETVVAVNASAERAETSEKNAKESAEKAETTLVDMKETVGNLTETVEQAEKLDGNLDKKLEQGENIVANIKDKLDVPENPMVGKYLRVKAVNEDGVPELEWVDEPSGGSSLDIQINGQSIVKDGVAEIPIATNNGKFGLVKLTGEFAGLANDNGILKLKRVSNNFIDMRLDYGAPITSGNIDYAVKAAMCDGKGAAWTAEEQAAARERIGITDLKKVVSATLEEESLINITLDKDGNAFDYDEAYIRLIIPKTLENIGTSFVVGDIVFFANGITNASWNMNYLDIYAKRTNSIGFCEYISHTNSEGNMGYVFRSVPKQNIRKFYKFGSYKPFPAGTKIIIYAR